MNLIVTLSCAGKTTLCKNNEKYVDLDLFQQVYTPFQRKLIRNFICNIEDNERIFLINVSDYFKYNLKEVIKPIKVFAFTKERYLQSIELFKKRNILNYGVVAPKKLEIYKKSYERNSKRIESFDKQLIIYLNKDEFLSDYLK